MVRFGYSSSLAYKNYGAGEGNIFVGGALDISRLIDEKREASRWRLGIMRITEDGTNPSKGAAISYINNREDEADIAAFAPIIDHMHLDDSSLAGEEWLIGSTKSFDPAQAGEQVFLFKVKLDPTTHAPSETLTCIKIFELGKTGYITAVKPSLDGQGRLHFTYYNPDHDGTFYVQYGWDLVDQQEMISFRVSDNVIQPFRGAFVGTKMARSLEFDSRQVDHW